MYNVYTAKFTGMLAIPRYKYLANSVEEVAANGNITVYNQKGTTAEELIMVNGI